MVQGEAGGGQGGLPLKEESLCTLMTVALKGEVGHGGTITNLLIFN
jgi:hypothetical protein